MSLHLGNLSSRVSISDLERVFRRFGRCSIKVKDKYGFVVYDYPASAEKALKKLQGNRICGEAITISWSKRQPQHKPRPSRGDLPYDPPHRTFPRREVRNQRLDLNNRPEYEMHGDDEARGDNVLTETVDEPNRNHQNDLKDVEIEARLTPSNDQHGVGSEGKNDLEDDRWEEDVVDYSDEKYETGVDFDRYEPINNEEENELDELQDYSPLTDSIPAAKSHEGPNNSPHTKSQRGCNLCGEVGHEIGKCPLQGTVQRGSSSKEPIDLNESIVIEHVESATTEKFTAEVGNQHQPRDDTEEEEMERNRFEKDDKLSHSIPKDLHQVDDAPNPSTSNSNVPARSSSSRLSSEEIYKVLKHYGLPYPNENEKDLPVEVYFGSARSWPWEIIYYRRLRKGSISAENYSRRTTQNKEFGIVDRYIRGSSGWAEKPEH